MNPETKALRCIMPALVMIALARPVAGAADPSGFNFDLRETPLTLRAEATSRRFVAAHGRRGMIAGYAAESLEGWVYPFRIFHDYRVAFREEGSDRPVPGQAYVRTVLVNPESATRIYSGQNFTVRETLFVPLHEGGFELLYQVDSALPLDIEVSFKPDLNLMWPGGIGGQSYDWDSARHTFLLQESSGKYSALVGSPAAGAHSAPDSYAEPWQADRRLSFELHIPAHSGSVAFPVIAALSAPPYYQAATTYDDLLAHTPALYAAAVEHYRKLASGGLQIETPGARVNLAYTWARITLDQAYVCNPWLGCGLVAGYGPSRDTRRPQYAWFFGGDALDNSFALEASGDYALARDAFRFIQKYQKKDDGEIFHELSQSAGLIDWFKDYPYAYRHTDTSALYLAAFWNLYRASGDRAFVRSSWESLEAAYQYLVSRIDPRDGLVTVPAGGWGGDETIGEQVVKDIYLESVWVAGAEAFAGLAEVMDDSARASDARARAAKARSSVTAELWDPKRDFFDYGFNGKGQLLTQELSQPDWGIWKGVFGAQESARALDNMAHARWETDWGVRSIPRDDPLYIGDSYGHGSVWPLGTAFQALAFYSHHRPLDAFPLWRALIEDSFLNSLGHVSEVFSGDFYRELNVSVPEQIWSSGGVITSTVRGMLGLDPDVPDAELHFAPHLPPDWPGVAVSHVEMGPSTLALRMEQSEGKVTLHVTGEGPPVTIRFDPEIPLGSRNLRATLNRGPVGATLRNQAQEEYAEVTFKADGSATVSLSFESGVRVWVPAPALEIGARSRGLRVLASTLDGRTYSAQVEGRPDACSELDLLTPWGVAQADGAKVAAHEGHTWRFRVSPTPESCTAGAAPSAFSAQEPYRKWTVRVQFAR